MKYILTKKINQNIKVLMNRLGYHLHLDPQAQQSSYIRRLGSLYYPRFHLYLSEQHGGYVLNLHLDEKKPSYAGTHRHAGQYDGDLVEEEMKRLAYYLLHNDE